MAENENTVKGRGKLYAIKAVFGSIRFPLYESKELAEMDKGSMPDSYTDYEHFEIVEVPVVRTEDGLVWCKPRSNKVLEK